MTASHPSLTTSYFYKLMFLLNLYEGGGGTMCSAPRSVGLVPYFRPRKPPDSSFVQKRAARLAGLVLLLALGAFVSPAAHAQTITLTPNNGPFGSTFDISGTGFPIGATINAFLAPDPSSAPSDCQTLSNIRTGGFGQRTADASGTVAFEDIAVSAEYVIQGPFFPITIDGMVLGTENYLCLFQEGSSNHSPVVQFEVRPSIALMPTSGLFGSTFTASGADFSGSEKVVLHLLSNPASAPASCTALRNASGAARLDSANASSGSVTISDVSVLATDFVRGDDNYLCLRGNTSATESLVVQFEVLPPTITLTPNNGPFGSTFDISGTGFPTGATINAFLAPDPSSAPSDCQTLSNIRTGGFGQRTADASGTVAFEDIAVSAEYVIQGPFFPITIDGMVLGTENYLCLFQEGGSHDSPVVQFEVRPSIALMFSPAALDVNEGESTAFTVRLARAPRERTTWILESDRTIAEVSRGRLSFTPSNWNTPQPIAVAGRKAGRTRIRARFLEGDSGGRAASPALPVTVSESPGAFVLSRSSLDLKPGETRSFLVRLARAPSAGVSEVWKLTSDLDVQLAPETIYFDHRDWDVQKSVVVTGGSAGEGWIYAARVEGDDEPEALVRLAVAGSRSLDVSLWNGADRDGIIHLWEGTSTNGGFSVALSEKPTGTVTVTASSGGGAVVYPRSRTFTPANWSRRQDFSLSPGDDSDSSDEFGTVTLVARGGGYGRVGAAVRVCVDDATDSDATCTYGEPERKRPGDDPGDPPDECPPGHVCLDDSPLDSPPPSAEDGAKDIAHTGATEADPGAADNGDGMDERPPEPPPEPEPPERPKEPEVPERPGSDCPPGYACIDDPPTERPGSDCPPGYVCTTDQPKEAGKPQAAVELRRNTVPDQPVLQQNAPNPFNASTVIAFELPAGLSGPLRLSIYNLSGQLVRVWPVDAAGAGAYRLTWDGRADDGRPVASGVYVYRLETDAWALHRRMVLLR